MQKLFSMVLDTRSEALGDQLELLLARVERHSKHGAAIRDVAITSWMVFSNYTPIGGDTDTHITVIRHYMYDMDKQCVTGGLSAMDALREIWQAYGPNSTLPTFGHIPGAVDIEYTITVFTN